MYAIDNIIIEPTNNWPHINNQVLTINIGITNLIILIVNRPSKNDGNKSFTCSNKEY